MSVKIITKHETGGAGDVPLAADLEKGELGVNTVDGKLWVGDGASTKLLTPSGGLVDGLADGNTLRWEASTSEWEATSALVVDDAGNVTASGDVSGGSITATSSHRYGTNLHLVNTSTGGTSWSINSSGQDSVLGAGNLELSVTSQGPKAVLKANGDFTASKFIGDGSQLTNLPAGSQWDDVTGGINYAGGRVGIGTDSPTGILTVPSESIHFDRPSDHWTTTTYMGVAGYGGITTHGSNEISIVANGYRNSAGTWTSNGTNGYTGATAIHSNPQGFIRFCTEGTKASGSASAITERMRIDASGNVKINTGNLELSNGGGWFQSDASWVRSLNDKAVYNGNTTANSFTTPGDFTAGYSDMRLKTHLGTIPDALDKVCSLEGFYYERNDTAQSLGYQGGERRVGLSAQDVQAVLPEVVKDAPINVDNGTDYLTVDYERVVPLLVESIKELKAEIDALKGNKDA